MVEAPAKINLFLRVLERGEDGYHRVETCLAQLHFSDHLVLRRRDAGIRLEVEGAELGDPEDNLVMRAARRFFAAAEVDSGVAIRLHKHIPTGAGLGGGSSDAASALRALNMMFDSALPDVELHTIAAGLGSDVPFFLGPSPWALGRGRGEQLTPVTPLPEMPVLLAVPPFVISTAEAYARLRRGQEDEPLTDVLEGMKIVGPPDWPAAVAMAQNDFEDTTFAQFPLLADLARGLGAAGASIALLSGSGSVVFGVFADDTSIEAAVEGLSAKYPQVHFQRTRTRTQLPQCQPWAGQGA
jgi:4-diphosphocytidyl-2-C-methyl-D-erythritol kinase